MRCELLFGAGKIRSARFYRIASWPRRQANDGNMLLMFPLLPHHSLHNYRWWTTCCLVTATTQVFARLCLARFAQNPSPPCGLALPQQLATRSANSRGVVKQLDVVVVVFPALCVTLIGDSSLLSSLCKSGILFAQDIGEVSMMVSSARTSLNSTTS